MTSKLLLNMVHFTSSQTNSLRSSLIFSSYLLFKRSLHFSVSEDHLTDLSISVRLSAASYITLLQHWPWRTSLRLISFLHLLRPLSPWCGVQQCFSTGGQQVVSYGSAAPERLKNTGVKNAFEMLVYSKEYTFPIMLSGKSKTCHLEGCY
jgi:hypothetical protein